MALGRLFLIWCLWISSSVAASEIGGTDTDESSLLQVGVNSHVGRNVPSIGYKDVPQGPRAWALFQNVEDGQDVRTLSNVTDLVLPGHQNGSFAPHQHSQNLSYYSPVQDELVPSFVYFCLGEDWHPSNFSSWKVEKVLSPQLVPYVVPEGQPNRTDVSIIIAPGGGSEFLAWEAEGIDLARALNLMGISAFVLKYRIPVPEVWEDGAQIMDAQRAISLVKHFAPAMNLNKSRVGFFGASHGGFVGVTAAIAAGRGYPRRDIVDDEDFLPDFLLLNYPELRQEDLFARLHNTSQVYPLYGIPIGRLEHLPPIFMASGVEDKCVPPQVMYDFHEMLMDVAPDGVIPRVELNIFSGIGHGFTSCYRANPGGWDSMQHEGCMWLFRARRFIMWEVENKVPAEVEQWYSQVEHFVAPSLLNPSSVTSARKPPLRPQ